jgi:hypothetical protein
MVTDNYHSNQMFLTQTFPVVIPIHEKREELEE